MQTTTRVLVRSLALAALLGALGQASRLLEGDPSANADIGGGFVLVGILAAAAAVWAWVDVRSARAGRWLAVWAATGVGVGILVDVVSLVRQGAQPIGDLVVVGGFVGVVVALPAVLAALLAQPAHAPAR